MPEATDSQFSPRKSVDWAKVREAYVQRPTRSSFDELAAEFSVAAGTIGRCSSDEGWPALRARYLESQLAAADASSVLLTAIRGDRTVSTAYLSLAVVTLATLQGIVEEVRASDKASSTKADTINNCTFAAKNIADALKTVGIVGIAKLMGEGKEDNGRWNPQMLSQINLTVQNLVGQAKTAEPSVAPSSEPTPAPPV